MINLKLQLIVCSVFLFILNTVYAEETMPKLSIEELKEVAQSIEKTERSLLNIRFESEAWVESGASSSGPWQRTPVYLSSTAFFNGLPGSKARLDIHKLVLEWKNGSMPHLEKNYSASFDGQYGRYVYHSVSHNEKTFRINKGSILPDAPHELRSRWYHKMIGINASMNFHFSDKQGTFSSYFQKAAGPNFAIENGEVEFVHQEFRGSECIKMSFKGKRFRKSWRLDPNRGFALLNLEYIRKDKDGNEVLQYSIDVKKIDKVAENIWWPVEAYFVSSPFGVEKPWERIVYHATNVVANDPNFDEAVFTVPFPDGYLIGNNIMGKEYKAGEK